MSEIKLLKRPKIQNFQSFSSQQIRVSFQTSPNLKADFDEIQPKARSEQSEFKDPTITNNKVSILSQFSSQNKKESGSDLSNIFEQNDVILEAQENSQNIQTTKNKSWQQRNNSPRKPEILQIVRKFWEKLKNSSSLWEQELNNIQLLEDNYLKDILRQKVNNFNALIFNYIFLTNQFLSYIILPLIVTLNINCQILSSIIIIVLIIQNVCKYLKKKPQNFYQFIILFFDIYYIISYAITIFGELEFSKICLLFYINCIAQSILMRLKKKDLMKHFIHPMWYFIPILIYINLLTTVWISFQKMFCSQSEIPNIYINSLICMINNMVPYNSIYYERNPSCYELEQIFSLFVQILSIFLEIILAKSIMQQIENYSKIKQIATYFDNNGLKKSIRNQSIQIIDRQLRNSKVLEFNECIHLMNRLPLTLQKSIEIHVKTQKLMQSRFFKEYFSTEILEQFANVGELYQCQPNELLPIKDSQNQYCYLIIKGKVAEYQTLGEQDQLLTYLSKNNLIGLTNLFYNCCNSLVYKSYSQTILLKLNNSNIFEIIRKNQSTKERFYQLKYDIIFNSKYQLLLQNCSICSQDDHCTENCPKVHFIVNQRQLIKRIQYSEPNLRNCFRRTINFRINSLSNWNTVKCAARKFRKNNSYTQSDDEGQVTNLQYYDQAVEDDVSEQQYNIMNYPSNSNVTEKPKEPTNNDFISRQTLNDILYYQDENQYLHDLNRIQVMKSLQSPQFQEEQYGEQVMNYNAQLQSNNKQILKQQSNTFKSSSGQTYQSQRSSRQRQKSQQNPQSVEQNKIRIAQPKLTFQYDPQSQNQGESYQALLRPHIRTGTNQNSIHQSQAPQPQSGLGLPIVSEESPSQLNVQLGNNYPQASMMSISSVGIASMEDNIRNRTNSYTGGRRISNKQYTNTSGVSPGHSGGRPPTSGSYSQSYLSSQRQPNYMSDFDDVSYLVKSSFELDKGMIYQDYKPFNNYDIIVNQIRLSQIRYIRKNKNQ